MKTPERLIFCALWLLGLTGLWSQAYAGDLVDDELMGLYGSEEMISIATGYRQPVSKAPAVASVIDAEEIKRMGATDLNQVLEAVPGLHVAYNHQGYNPIYTFRGIYSDFNPQVLLLFNGVPQTNLFTGGKNVVWAGMPVEAIKRIEIIRGPGSAVYGADAFAGVINVIMKDGSSTRGLEVGARYGTYNTKELFASYGKQWGDSSLGLFLEAKKSDGQNEKINADAQTTLDAITGTNATLAPRSVSMSRENIDLRVDYRYKNLVVRGGYQSRRDGGVGAGVAEALDPHGRFKSDRYLLDIGYKVENLLDNLSLDLMASYFDVSQEVERDAILFPPGSTGPFLDPQGQPLLGVFNNGVISNPEVFERHTRLNAVFQYKGFENHDLSLGTGYYQGDLHRVKEEKNYCTDPPSCAFILPAGGVVDVSDTPFVFLKGGRRENYFVYLQDVYSLAPDWQLTAGVRYDDYSDFGDTVNPRLALVWSTTNSLTTKFLYGEAFRAPAFQETRNINNPAFLGNPDLDPESLKSYELVFDYKAVYDLGLVFNAFYYEWEDIIQFVPDAVGGTSTAQNDGRQTGFGFEIEAKWGATSDLDLLANFAWQQSTNEKTDRSAADSPGRQLYVQANWAFHPRYHLNLQANWVMDRKRELRDPRSAIDDYVWVDLSLRRNRGFQHVELALHVKNLFDEDAREPSPSGVPVPSIPGDLPLPGRTIMGEVRYHF